jgi:hypothetical protein
MCSNFLLTLPSHKLKKYNASPTLTIDVTESNISLMISLQISTYTKSKRRRALTVFPLLSYRKHWDIYLDNCSRKKMEATLAKTLSMIATNLCTTLRGSMRNEYDPLTGFSACRTSSSNRWIGCLHQYFNRIWQIKQHVTETI